MAQYSRPLLKTYSSRRSLGLSLPSTEESVGGQASSPLERLNDQEDLPVSEMSRRMKKRSRTIGKKGLSEDVICSPAQRNKASENDDVAIERNNTLDSFTMQRQNLKDLSYQTPRPSKSPIKESDDENAMKEPLSPVPLARRMLSRTSSRNMKENALNRNLASPFSSRPGSRTSSPERAARASGKRPRLHVKSRTLSSSAMRTKLPLSTLRRTPIVSNSHEVSLHVSPTVKAQQGTHNRTTSIPAVPTNSFDQISSQSWRIPPKALSRSPITLSEPMDNLLIEYPSFYFDVPLDASTPARDKEPLPDPRKTRQASIYSDDSDFEMSDLQDSPTQLTKTAIRALVPPASPRRQGRRRRTIMHVSSDSIFSSGLDFSAYVTDDESPGHVRKTTERGPSVQRGAPESGIDTSLGLGLDAAFSPADDLPPIGKRSIRAIANHRSDDDLHNLISTLDLSDPDQKLAGSDTNATSNHVYAAESISSASSTRQRRKRGDTIRASDYPRPPIVSLPPPPVNMDYATLDMPVARTRITRRTRSGTVTQANPSTQTSVATSVPDSSGGKSALSVQAATGKTTRSRPDTQKRKRRTQILTRPAAFDSPPPPDDEDDELLLTDDNWKELQ